MPPNGLRHHGAARRRSNDLSSRHVIVSRDGVCHRLEPMRKAAVTRLIDFALANRFLVILGSLLLAGGGFWAMTRLPVDAVPDVTNVQVQVMTTAPALGPLEVEQFITGPVEAAMSGMPRVEEIRSVSQFGLPVVPGGCEEGTDIYWARQLVGERLQHARERIPAGVPSPQLGPVATGLGEIYQFEVRSKPGHKHSLMELRE